MKNVIELKPLFEQLNDFEASVIALANAVGLNIAPLHCDHISLRCNSQGLADLWRNGFMQCADLLSDKEINGRPICLFGLYQPLDFLNKKIDCVELPYPSAKSYINEGWEHIEFVIRCDPEQLHQRALALLSDQGLMTPGIKVKCANPKGRGEELANPTLAITEGVVTIKFHPYTLREIIASERS